MTAFTPRMCQAMLIIGAALVPYGASAQVAPIAVRSPLYEGECVLSLEFAEPIPPSLLKTAFEVQVNGQKLDLALARWPKPAEFDGRHLTLGLGDSFQKRDKVRAVLLPDQRSSEAVQVQPSPLAVSCKQPSKGRSDERPRLSSIALVGASSETFAPEIDRVQAAFGTNDGGLGASTHHLQLLTEFSLDYRVTPKERRPLWILTHARYFAQQTSVCTSDASGQEICRREGGTFSPNQAFKNVENARVAEFTLGLRYEFATLDSDDSPVNLYAIVTGGSLFVVGVDDKQLNDIFVGGGFVVTKGRFRDTHVETGAGLSEVFAPDHADFNRWKANAMFVTDGSALKFWNPVRFFVRFALDRATGPDSYRTSYGVIFDLGRVFGGL